MRNLAVGLKGYNKNKDENDKKNYMLKVLIILIFISLLPNISFSKELNDKIKFHPPETEAESALDRILKIDNEIIKGGNNDKDTFTKDFIIEDDKQAKKAQESDPDNLDGGPCLLADSGRNCGFLTGGNDISTNIGFLYYTNKIENNIIYI